MVTVSNCPPAWSTALLSLVSMLSSQTPSSLVRSTFSYMFTIRLILIMKHRRLDTPLCTSLAFWDYG